MVADAAAWRTWLNGNHAKSQGVRLVLAKKGTTHPTTISYDEALDEAICFGWIDGQLGRRDSTMFLRRFTPRNARSPWSQRNVAIAERLSASGRMHRSGDDEVRRRRRMVDGRPPTPVRVAHWFQRTWRGHWRSTPVLRRCFKRSRVRTGTPSSIGSEARRRSRPEPGESSSLWRCWPEARPFTQKVHAHPSSWPSITEQMAPNAGSAGQIPVQPASSDHTGERRTPLKQVRGRDPARGGAYGPNWAQHPASDYPAITMARAATMDNAIAELTTSFGRLPCLSAPAVRDLSRPGVAPGGRQLPHPQAPRCWTLVSAPQAFPPPLHADQRELDESGRSLVLAASPPSYPPRCLQKRALTSRGHSALPGRLEQELPALHLDQASRPDPRSSRP